MNAHVSKLETAQQKKRMIVLKKYIISAITRPKGLFLLHVETDEPMTRAKAREITQDEIDKAGKNRKVVECIFKQVKDFKEEHELKEEACETLKRTSTKVRSFLHEGEK